MTATRLYYSTLDQAKQELSAETNADNADILDYLEKVSTRVDALMSTQQRPYFAPYQEQKRLRLNSTQIVDGGTTFKCLFPLQSFSEVLLGATDHTSDMEVDFENQGALRWTGSTGNFANLLAANTPGARLNITGVWGFSLDYANAWLDSGDSVQDNPLAVGATTLTVSDSSLFAEGQLLQIESEWLLVAAIASDTTLTVVRGVHGTAAAEHANATAIDIFNVNETVQRLVARQAALWYARKGAFQQQTFDGVGVVSYPPDLLTELENALRELTYAD